MVPDFLTSIFGPDAVAAMNAVLQEIEVAGGLGIQELLTRWPGVVVPLIGRMDGVPAVNFL